MIDRLGRSLEWLAGASAADLHDRDRRADCADAVRLALDCMQQELSRDQRARLAQLHDLLEEDDVAPASVNDAARRARELLAP